MTTRTVCAAADRGCGTPTGWRNKGRCPKCRAAHNEDTARRRRARNAPPMATISELVDRLLRGEDLTYAASQLGIHPRTAQSLAKDHDSVAAALRGLAEGQAYRQAEYLRLLLEGNSFTAARQKVPIAWRTIQLWRKDPAFAAAETAIDAFISGNLTKQRGMRRRGGAPVRAEAREVYLRLLGEGKTSAEAMREAGLSANWLNVRRRTDPEFNALVLELMPSGSRRGRPPRPIDEPLLRQLWHDETVPLQKIYDRLGATRPTVIQNAVRLGLEWPRPRVPKRRDHTPRSRR